jgi:hypothetical protein
MALVSEIIKDTSGIDNILPRWLRVSKAIAYSGFPRATLYRLLGDGVIRSSVVNRPGSKRSMRVVDRLSIDAYLEAHSNQPQ